MCQFSIAHTTTPETMYARAQAAMRSAGGTLDGTTEAGGFNLPVFGAAIVGTYRTSADAIVIEITDKPFLIGCGIIEEQLRKKLGG